MNLTFFAEEEQRNGPGTGMCADDRADIIGEHGFYAKPLLDLLRDKIGVLLGIAVADEDRLRLRIDRALCHPVYKRGKGGFAPARFAHINQMPLVVHMEDGLDVQHRAD